MAKVKINVMVFNDYLRSEDEDFKALAWEARNNFSKYAELVQYFERDMKDFKTLPMEEFRIKMVELDTKRRAIHNACIDSINIMNRIAKSEGLVFAEMETDEREEIAKAIFIWVNQSIRLLPSNMLD